MDKIKINFSKPHITYRDSKGEAVVGVTTALNKLAKPALIGWAFTQGQMPYYDSLDDALKEEGIDLKKLSKRNIALQVFGAGQTRKNQSLYTKVDKAAEIGTIAHEILNARDSGYEIDNSTILPEVWKMALECVKSHDAKLGEEKVKPIFTEKPLVSKKYRYGGTIDKYYLIGDIRVLRDYKTGSGIYPDHFYQLAGYTQLMLENGHKLDRVEILNLPKTKGDSFAIQSKSIDELMTYYFPMFMASVDAYYAEKAIKKYSKTIFS